MTFLDTLRAARESRVSVLHEFWTHYDPHSKRLYAFFEGHDDVAFFVPHIERVLARDCRLYRFDCGGKPRVIQAFEDITRRLPDVRRVLFFVDKDLDDVLGTPWPTDPRIFVTDVYSVENYLVDSTVLARFYRDSVRLHGVTFDELAIGSHFESQLKHFHRRVLGLMAWILVARREGGRPNLGDLDVGKMLRFAEAGEIRRVCGVRLSLLARQTGVTLPHSALKRVRSAIKELARMPAKRIVRGKFEAWYFVEYWKNLVEGLRLAAQEEGGKVSVRLPLSESGFVATLASYADTPYSLSLFLRAHLEANSAFGREETKAVSRPPWWRRWLS